jgi:hypothetical protein
LELSTEVKQLYKERLKDFSAISVREKDAVDLLKEFVSQQVEHVLDPTLLLNVEQWDRITSERIIQEKYAFCYFLGEDNEMRNIAKSYAQEHNLVLVNMKHASGQYHKVDINYSDRNLEAPAPTDFLSLIKYAEMVFTDSFHACVFSLLFKRQFFAFERAGYRNMGTRIISLMELFGTESRFCNTAERRNIKYIDQQPLIDYSKECSLFDQMKLTSINFLEKSLTVVE